MNPEPRWLSLQSVLTIHKDQAAQFGGSFQVRDLALLESALARPQNRQHYEPEATIYRLAAAYGFGSCRNHPFVDGNKRVAFLSMYVFLGLNGYLIEAPEPVVVEIMLRVAGGTTTEEQLAEWLALHARLRRRSHPAC
jgi:death-on-curing protein